MGFRPSMVAHGGVLFLHLGSSLNPILFWAFMKASLPSQDWFSHWPLAIDSNSSQSIPDVSAGHWEKTETSNLLTERLDPQAIRSHPWVFSKSHLVNATRDSLIVLFIWKTPRVFGAWFQEQDKKPNPGNHFNKFENWAYFQKRGLRFLTNPPTSFLHKLSRQWGICHSPSEGP